MKSIRFEIPDELHQKLKIKLAKEGRQQKELFLTLSDIYVSDENDRKKKGGPGSSKES